MLELEAARHGGSRHVGSGRWKASGHAGSVVLRGRYCTGGLDRDAAAGDTQSSRARSDDSGCAWTTEPGDTRRELRTSVRWVARLGGSSGVRATWALQGAQGLGLAGVPVGRAVLHKSAGSVGSEVLVLLDMAGRPG